MYIIPIGTKISPEIELTIEVIPSDLTNTFPHSALKY